MGQGSGESHLAAKREGRKWLEGDFGLSCGISSAFFHACGWQAGGFRLGGGGEEFRTLLIHGQWGTATRWAGEGGWGARWQAGCSALLLLLLLHPRPKGWFIFRFKTRAFLSSLLNLLLGAGAVCPGRVWGGHPWGRGRRGAPVPRSLGLAASATPETAVGFLVPVLLPFPAGGCTFY